MALKSRMASAEILDQHYEDLVKKPFFPGLRDYMLSGPVVSMVWEGKEAVSTGRCDCFLGYMLVAYACS